MLCSARLHKSAQAPHYRRNADAPPILEISVYGCELDYTSSQIKSLPKGIVAHPHPCFGWPITANLHMGSALHTTVPAPSAERARCGGRGWNSAIARTRQSP